MNTYPFIATHAKGKYQKQDNHNNHSAIRQKSKSSVQNKTFISSIKPVHGEKCQCVVLSHANINSLSNANFGKFKVLCFGGCEQYSLYSSSQKIKVYDNLS